MAFQISPSPRIRKSPFFDATVAEGVTSFTVYNRMLMPTSYGAPMTEYWRLIEGVSMWDVACERQVEITGPDAHRLTQALVPRNIGRQPVGMGWYVPVCDHHGVLLNDPILLKLADDRFWLSIADSDVLFWARAVAAERGFNVELREPDVSPLAIQGPRAEDVVAALFDDSIRSLGYFRFREMELDGIPLQLARSGWSKQGGFELYLMDGRRGTELWQTVREAGRPFDIGPGTPNGMERIESGLLSWGGDTDDQTNPFEVRMGKYVDLDSPGDVVGIKALRRIKERGPRRHQIGIVLDMAGEIDALDGRPKVFKGATDTGVITAATWSPRLGCNIAMALLWTGVGPGDAVHVVFPDGRECAGEATTLPFL
jgi:aminomethyltransferase